MFTQRSNGGGRCLLIVVADDLMLSGFCRKYADAQFVVNALEDKRNDRDQRFAHQAGA